MSDWVETTLDQVVELKRGFDLPSDARRAGPYPVLSAGLVAGWHDEGPIKGPGLTIGRATNLGQPTWSQGDFWPLNTTLYVSDFGENVPRWVYHLFESKDLRGYDSGSVQPMLNRNYIAKVRVRVPPKVEQHAIADVLGSLDDKIAANQRVESAARNLAALIFRRVASGSGGHGTVLKLGDLSSAGALSLGDGYRTKRNELADNGYLIVRVADVDASEVRWQGSDFVRREYAAAIGSKAGQVGDIIVTTKGTVGRVALVRDVGDGVVYSPQICFFRVHENDLIDRWFLRYWFESQEFSRQAAHRMDNSDMAPYINLGDIRSLRISLPPIEQQRVAAQTLSVLDQFLASLLAENRGLAELRDTLLPPLMSGRLRVKDAEKQVEAVV